MRIPLLLLALSCAAIALEPTLPGTQPLTVEGDLSVQMVDGINRWLAREAERAKEDRTKRWREAIGPAWEPFATAQRAKLRDMLGVVPNEKQTGAFERIPLETELVAAKRGYRIERVRWPVLEGLTAEGILLMPAGVQAMVILLPDPDALEPSTIYAEKLAAKGCAVLVPSLLDRDFRFSGSKAVNRWTNQPHREWIYRQAFELGRTAVGYEVQTVVAAIDSLLALLPIGAEKLAVIGRGEGGLIALHAAALDPRIANTLVGGYFGPHEQLYREPIYRNLFGVLRGFGNAELAALIHPRRLVVEYSATPQVSGPPEAPQRPKGAAPGVIEMPPFAEVEAETKRTSDIMKDSQGPLSLYLLSLENGAPFQPFAGDASMAALGLELKAPEPAPQPAAADAPAEFRGFAAELRALQETTVTQLEQHTQRLIRAEERGRTERYWKGLKPGPAWDATQRDLRERLWASIGKLPGERLAPNPRSRVVLENPKWTAYDVMLDVQPDIFAWGWLLLPKDLKPGERRPVVVCQHGLEGLPADTVTDDQKAKAYAPYKAFAARLAERGFIVYAPHNPYRGQDRFREINRRANPLALSLFSFIVDQHDVTTQWLAGLPFVDPERIGFYGLSYGGKTAMRVPALVDRYCLSICSGDFNEWVYKNSGTDYRPSYMFAPEYEIFEWNLGTNANYAEMAMLIAPRPFMVERGHEDGVALDEWCGYEYAKVLRGYTKLGLKDRTEIEWFDGPHTINGVGSYEFLHKHLRWPGPK